LIKAEKAEREAERIDQELQQLMREQGGM